MPVFELVVREGPDSGRVIPVEDGATLVLGRALDTDVHLEDAHVSRRHCRIEATAEHLRVTDLESANGTFIDGTPVDQGRLQPGQTLRLGPFVLECHVGEESAREPSRFRVGDRDSETVVSRLESPSATGMPDADSRSRNLEVAYRLSKSLARTLDPAQLLDRVIDEVFEVVDADQVAVLRPSEDGPLRPEALDPVAIRTRPGLSPREIVVSTSVVEEVLGEGVSTLSTHALSDERFRDADSVVDQEIHSLLCAPLQSDAGPQGVLYADNRRGGGAFSEADLQLFSVIGNEAGSALRRTELATELEEFFSDTVRAVVAAVDAKDGYTHRHSERVSSCGVRLAEALGVEDEERLEQIRLAGLLHDIGKIGVSDRILNKGGDLTDEERREVRQHPEFGEDILGRIRTARFRQLLPGIRHHHERWDGSGYPDGLAGDEIPPSARVIAVADVLDALTSDRSYREALDLDRAVSVIEEGAGTHFDPEVARAAVQLHERDALFGEGVGESPDG